MSSPKRLEATTVNLIGFAAGLGSGNRQPTDEHYTNYFDSSYEDYLAMCQRLTNNCDNSQKEAIKLIIQEIVRQSNEMKVEVATGKRMASHYLKPLEKTNCWGKAVIALVEAFEVKLEQVTT